MSNEVVFTCRIPEKHCNVFENYVMIQVMAAQADAVITTRNPTNSKKIATSTIRIIGASTMLIERARSRISGRAIELSKIEGG